MPMSVSEAAFNARRAKSTSENELQTAIIAFAKRGGWLVYHTYDSRRSEPGYPDLHLVHAGLGRSLFRELKTQTGRVSPEQRDWLEQLVAVGCDAKVWRPIDWYDGTVERELNGGTR